MEHIWITPLMKQGFVVTGVSLNIGNFGAVTAFTAILLPQLRDSDSSIKIDETTGSWTAAIVGISLIFGNILGATIINFGRKPSSLFCCLLLLICWMWIAAADDVWSLLIARFLQGFALGINLSLCPIMIGEMTSPSNRGVFSSVMNSLVTSITLMTHVLGSYLHWRTVAIINAFLCLLCFAILIFSPESPSWLAERNRIEESRKIFKWLRGDEEEDELEKMLATRIPKEITSKAKRTGVTNNIVYVIKSLRKKEVYKPIIIMIHIHAATVWAGLTCLAMFIVDVIKAIAGDDIDVALQLTILDTQRLFSTLFSMYAIKYFKRKNNLLIAGGINFIVLIIIAVYMYAKMKGILPFDHPAIGMILIHIHMCSFCTGAIALPMVLASELFPLEFRSLAGGISALSFSLNYFITSKTTLALFRILGVDEAYFLYAGVTLYTLAVCWILLPETKDKTLQEIEETFRGERRTVLEANLTQALTSLDNSRDDEA